MVLGDSTKLSESDWGRLEELIAAFEESWKRGERPKIADFLADDEPHRLALLIELVHTEFEYRLKNNESARVEDYLEKYPSLGHARETVLDLIRAEWSFRKRTEPELSVEQFVNRFPNFRDDLDHPKSEPLAGTTISLAGLVESRAAESVDPPLPRRFGKYQLRQKIGHGTFGVVYRAWDLVMNREVAVKIPRPELIAAHQNVRAFLREARNAIDLRHPNIVAIHDAGPIEGVVCIVRAYVEGTTLADQIRDAPLVPEESAALMTLVTEALEYAHQKGIIHRDLKPSNILIDLQGQPHIADFGLAKRESVDSTLSSWSRHGGMIGTPAYMSPEQARGKPHSVDARSDVFSAGVVLYELLTGSLPFRGRGRVLLVQIQELDPTPPRFLNEEVTEDLEAICLKALAKDPEDRYQTAGEMTKDLRAFLGGRPIPPRLARPRPPRVHRWRPRSIPRLVPIGLVTLLVAATILWLRAEDRRNRDIGFTGQSYRALLDLGRQAERPGRDSSGRRVPMARQIWTEAEKLAPSLENDLELLPLAVEARRKLAEHARDQGSDRAAEVHWQKAVSLGQRLVSQKPTSAADHENLADSLVNLASIRDRSGDKAAARSLLERAVALRRETLDDCRQGLGTQPDETELPLELAEILVKIAEVDHQLGKPLELGEVESIALAAESQTSNSPETIARLASLELNLAGLELASEIRLKAIEAAERAQKLFQERPESPIAPSGVARAWLIMARANQQRNRLPEARKFNRLAIERLESILLTDPDSAEIRRWLGTAQYEYGQLLDQSGSRLDAISSYRKSLQIRLRLARETPENSLALLQLAETRSALSLEPENSAIRSTWSEMLAIGDRLRVLTLAPGLEANRRELRRLSSIFLEKLRARLSSR